jgi:hypothetical protein
MARDSRKRTKISSKGATRRTPTLTTTPQQIMETMKPARPTIIIGLRPLLSERRAQNGELKAHNRAEREKIAATMKSGNPIDRPMAGRTDCMPVLPRAVTIETAKMIASDFVVRSGVGSSAADMLALLEPDAFARTRCER